VQLLEIAIIEERADHVRWDQLGTERGKLLPGRELETSIGARQRCFETSMEKVAGLNHDHAGIVAVRMAIGQPEELRRLGLLGHAASIDRKVSRFNLADRPGQAGKAPALWGRETKGLEGPGPGEAPSGPTQPNQRRPQRRRSSLKGGRRATAAGPP
jgi:hypothetical protein